MIDPKKKYNSFAPIALCDRDWPSRQITKAPIWCSVDLRDGNQALIEPMGHERKKRMYQTLIEMGFKEIEIGFPAASQTDFDFARWLIDEGMIPDDVTIQVLTQAREDLITRTYEAIKGARRAIVHIYNSTSTLQRRVVFGRDRGGIIDIAVEGSKIVHELAGQLKGTEVLYEYSPESFTGTELEYAKEICEAVMDVFDPRPDKKIILNLPATVEMSTPNTYADQIEWFHKNVARRDSYILSLHPHNDRGTGTAAAELGLLAGADRIEGTLFGNGERSGNVDVVNLALNMFTQGIDPELDISHINDLVKAAEYCNQLPVHPRHPYAGELVYTSFSGSHQDAINKGFAAMEKANSPLWEVPYLPIDPADVGRNYQAVIRVNSQSGKGGITYLLERDYGLKLPRKLLIEFSRVVQERADNEGAEISPETIWDCFHNEYLMRRQGELVLIDYGINQESSSDSVDLMAILERDHAKIDLSSSGNGPLNAFITGLGDALGSSLQIADYKEHAIGEGSDTKAVAYVEVVGSDKKSCFGVAMHENIITASLCAIISAVNRLSS